MTVTIKKSKANGVINAPPSKSVAHRALICAAFSSGSLVSNIAYSEDITATIDCLEALGATVKRYENSVFIGNLDPKNFKEDTMLYCNESGSTLRFMLPICLLCGKKITLKGTKKLVSRPLSVYEEICESNGFLFEKGEDFVTVCGKLTAGEYFVRGDISSQFITGLIFALSLLKNDSKIKIKGKIESKSYINLTLEVLKDFGIIVEFCDDIILIKGNCRYNSNDYFVEADCSNAAFLDSFNLLGGFVEVLDLNPDTTQGDYVYKRFFDELKQGVKQFDLSDCPDLAPIMFSMAAVFGGASFLGTKRLKIKESDRAQAMKQELQKFGIETKIYDNEVVIEGGKLKAPTENLCSHNDHRIVMSLAVLSSITGGTISGAEAVNKSYPEFFNDIKKLGIGLDLYETRQG